MFKYVLSFLILLMPSIVFSAQFDMWNTGMTLTEVVETARQHNVPIRRSGILSPNPNFDKRFIDEKFWTAQEVAYVTRLLGQGAKVVLKIHPERPRRVYEIGIQFTGKSSSKEFRSELLNMLTEKYGRPSRVLLSHIGLARSNYWPSVALTGNVDGNRTDNPEFGFDDFGGSVALVFSYNLFSGGGDRARVREARAIKSEFEKNLDQSRNNISFEVREAVARVRQTQEQLILQASSLKLVERNRELVEKEYNAGQASLVRLNEAQRDLTNTQGRLALARVELRRALKLLEAATGSIIGPYEDKTE